MLKCTPPPSKKLSKHAPLILVMKVKPEKVNLIIGSGGKKIKSIIEETGVDCIDTQDNGTVKITARDLASLEKSRAIISNLTMVPVVGDIYRNCKIMSIVSYGVFVEIVPGREAKSSPRCSKKHKEKRVRSANLHHPLAKATRERARERARERTIEKRHNLLGIGGQDSKFKPCLDQIMDQDVNQLGSWRPFEESQHQSNVQLYQNNS